MNTNDKAVKQTRSFAHLKNVSGLTALVTKLQMRTRGLPGIGVCNGPSGYGKTEASLYAQNKTRAIRVEVGDTWTRKTLLEKILKEGGVAKPRGTISSLVDQAVEMLGEEPNRPLFIDEADWLVDKGMIETARQLQERSEVPLLLIGEEQLPEKLRRIERVHNRVLDWYQAQPCDLEDTRQLAGLFLRGIGATDALLNRVRKEGEGRARRIVTTLDAMAEWARNSGVREIDERNYTGSFFTGTPPRRRDLPTLRIGSAA